MIEYTKYKKSRNLSWEILIRYNVTSLPVKISDICKSMGIRIVSYNTGRKFIADFDTYANPKSNDGFTYLNTIFYNDECFPARQRFTVAHELGHILLHDGHCIYNREPSENDNPIEQEANVFASRLLAPACVLWGLGVTNAQQISDICNISMQAAEFRMKRMNELYEREQDFIRRYGKSCFLLSADERKVYEQFGDYIQNHKL